MKFLFAITLFLSLGVHAGWSTFNCSTADGSLSFEQVKYNQVLKFTTVNWERKEVTSNDYNIEVKEENINVYLDEGICDEDDLSAHNYTYATKATFTQADGQSFPAGTQNLSQDGKSITAYVICSLQYGGNYCGPIEK